MSWRKHGLSTIGLKKYLQFSLCHWEMRWLTKIWLLNRSSFIQRFLCHPKSFLDSEVEKRSFTHRSWWALWICRLPLPSGTKAFLGWIAVVDLFITYVPYVLPGVGAPFLRICISARTGPHLGSLRKEKMSTVIYTHTHTHTHTLFSRGHSFSENMYFCKSWSSLRKLM